MEKTTGGVIAERVSALESSMVSLTKNVDRLVETQLNHKTPWGVVISAAVLLLAVFGLVIAPLKAELDALSARQDRLGDYVKTLSTHKK